MKRVLTVLLLLALLGGCGSPPAEAEPTPPPEEEKADILPELRQLEAISAPAVVTEGRAPAEDYELPPLPPDADWTTYRENMSRWVTDGPHIAVLAEDRASDAALYGLPLYANSSGESVLIRWGDSLAEFDWSVCPDPSVVLPQLFGFDVDGDQEEELIVICHVGSGTGVSLDELHILEKGPGGTLTENAFPESLWREALPELFGTVEISGRTFAVLGRELVECTDTGLDLDSASPGNIANFSFDGESLSFRGAFALCRKGSPIPCYVADTSAWISFRDGVFSMQGFHLYSYDN